MKTSNKLLLAPFLLFIVLGSMGAVLLKNSLVPHGIGSGANFIQGEGIYQKKEIPVDPFKKIDAGFGMQYELVKGEEMVVVEAEENLLPFFEAKVENDELVIQVKDGHSLRPSEDKPIKVKVGFEQLESLMTHGGASVVMKDTVEAEHFDCYINSSSYAKVLVKAKKIHTEIHSGADLEVSGQCEMLQGQAHSAGNLNALDLVCANVANITAHSGGGMQVNVLGVLNASSHSGAQIIYTGNPTRVNSNTHSGGSIRED